jgi:hypothetical protein
MVKKRAVAVGALTEKSTKKTVAGPHDNEAASQPPGAKRGAPEPTDRDGKGSKGVIKVIRDSFTMPVGDYELIGVLKKKCIGLGIAVKKSELLRAGLHALGRISDENLTQVVAAVENVKTGRPPGKKKRKKTSRAKGKRQ